MTHKKQTKIRKSHPEIEPASMTFNELTCGSALAHITIGIYVFDSGWQYVKSLLPCQEFIERYFPPMVHLEQATVWMDVTRLDGNVVLKYKPACLLFFQREKQVEKK